MSLAPEAPARNEGSGLWSTASASQLVLAYDNVIGFALVGSHATPEGVPCIRAFDLFNRRVAWEALHGEAWLSAVGRGTLAVRGRNVYITHEHSLYVLDLLTGRPKWKVELTATVADLAGYRETSGLQIFDPFSPDGRGAVLVLSVDNMLASFDRDTGAPLWQRQLDHPPPIAAVPGEGVVAALVGSKLEVINPAYAQSIAVIGKEFGRVDVEGKWLVARVMGAEDGVALVDPRTSRLLAYERVDGISYDRPSTTSGEKIFCISDDGDRIRVVPNGPNVPVLVPNYKAQALKIGGPTLFALLAHTGPQRMRRVVALDPATLAIRFDCGEIGAAPSLDEDHQIQTDGHAAVFVTSPTNDDNTCELRAVEVQTGRALWKRAVGEWFGHYFLGGYLVFYTRDKIGVLRPDDGRTIAEFPF
jgi:outer membrane protein assembly factor BamB